MARLDGCQIPCLPRIAEGYAPVDHQPSVQRLKRALARPWNDQVKKRLKRWFSLLTSRRSQWLKRNSITPSVSMGSPAQGLKPGEWVRVKTRQQIRATLDPFKELKGCAFLEEMWQYCGTPQRVLQRVERFLDERDYKVKRTSGIVLLADVICHGTPVFGRCDRGCHLFWREEWLEKLNSNPLGSDMDEEITP